VSTELLPFNATGTVQAQGGEPVRSVRISVWPTGPGLQTPQGIAYDHIAEAELEVADDVVGKANRQVEVEGQVYKIVWATAHAYLPHLELRLRRMGN
jgi:hypothetical protein